MSVSVNTISLCGFLLQLFAIGLAYNPLPLETMVRPIYWTKELIERIPYDTVFSDEIGPGIRGTPKLWDEYARIKASKPNPPYWKQPGFYESQGPPPSWFTATAPPGLAWNPQNIF
ncbi:uncharacterized protein LOC100679935 [Nasonia vitripennis]|uniref:Uncharacterized protein n=1 Tax=Nasonia vitripennis TaxID=7425 RepID=A0A7M7GFJ2_NASVI|nr:uncharacterized protein LOC100679935 [Nasonia vitripennis]